MAVSLGVEFIWKTGHSCKPHGVCSLLSSYYTLPGALHEMLSPLVVNLHLLWEKFTTLWWNHWTFRVQIL